MREWGKCEIGQRGRERKRGIKEKVREKTQEEHERGERGNVR